MDLLSSKKPVIAIVGGFDRNKIKHSQIESPPKEIIEQREACKKLGRILAKKGMRILVWSSEPHFIERYVVEGYLQEQDLDENSIICIYNQRNFPDFPEQKEKESHFVLKQSYHEDWEINFYESINTEADGIILMGGGPTTILAGAVAASWGKAVFSTPYFNGTAKVLYKWLFTKSKMRASAQIGKEDIDEMSKAWNPESCVLSLSRQLKKINEQKDERKKKEEAYLKLEEYRASIRFSQRMAVALLIVMLGFIVSMVLAITSSQEIIGFICFFLVLVFGGALGSLLSILGTQRKTSLPIVSLAAVGAGVGIVVGVVQISPNISQAISSEATFKVDIPLLFSSAIFAIFGGLAFESTIKNLMSSAKDAGNSSATKSSNAGISEEKEKRVI